MTPLFIIGSGGLAKEVAWMIECNNKEEESFFIKGYISKGDSNTYKYPVLGDDEWLKQHAVDGVAVCAIGAPDVRESVDVFFRDALYPKFLTIVSEQAIIADNSKIGDGCVICMGSIVSVDVSLGRFVICDRNTNIGHDSSIGDYVTISPGVCISGNVKIGNNTSIGTGASIIQGISIGDHVIVGAGATVVEDVPSNCTVVGVPARVIKRNGERVDIP